MKKITVANYKQDAYYAPIVKAVENLLREKGSVAPVELFIRMDLLSPESAEDWRRGRISYLERVIRCNLSKASRILSILRMHAHDSDLKPSLTVYMRWGKGPKVRLRFSKTGDPGVEKAYSTHFVWPGKGRSTRLLLETRKTRRSAPATTPSRLPALGRPLCGGRE